MALLIILHAWGEGPHRGCAETAVLGAETGPSVASLEMLVVALPMPPTWTGMRNAAGILHLLEAHPWPRLA